MDFPVHHHEFSAPAAVDYAPVRLLARASLLTIIRPAIRKRSKNNAASCELVQGPRAAMQERSTAKLVCSACGYPARCVARGAVEGAALWGC
jgi:hypothetical protein